MPPLRKRKESGEGLRYNAGSHGWAMDGRMKRATIAALLLGGLALPVCAQRLSVDPSHPYSASEQKQAQKAYNKSLKQQQKAAKKNQRAQQKDASKVNKARQQQIEQAQHH